MLGVYCYVLNTGSSSINNHYVKFFIPGTTDIETQKIGPKGGNYTFNSTLNYYNKGITGLIPLNTSVNNNGYIVQYTNSKDFPINCRLVIVAAEAKIGGGNETETVYNSVTSSAGAVVYTDYEYSLPYVVGVCGIEIEESSYTYGGVCVINGAQLNKLNIGINHGHSGTYTVNCGIKAIKCAVKKTQTVSVTISTPSGTTTTTTVTFDNLTNIKGISYINLSANTYNQVVDMSIVGNKINLVTYNDHSSVSAVTTDIVAFE